MPAHLAIYTDDPDKGGVAHYNHALATALVRAGFRVSLVQSASAGARVAERAALGIAHHWIGYDTQKDFARTITDTSDAEKALAALQPDLVYFSDCCAVSNIAGKQVAASRGIPFATIVHFVAPYLAERFQSCLRVVANQFAQARAVVAVSTENLELLRRLFGLAADQGAVIFNGVGERFFGPRDEEARREWRARHRIAPGTLVSLTTARLMPVKLHSLQIYAVELLRAQRAPGRTLCVWVGEGELRAALEAEIAKKGLRENFLFAGQQQDVLPWYDLADVFTLTSQSEGMPLAIMEAMARGLPIAATAVSGIPEQLGGEGVLLPSPERAPLETVQQLAATWQNWSRHPARRIEAGNRCRARAEAFFREETMVRNTRAMLERALAAGAALRSA